jgi:BirA family biotin operon repressor/biotin-[acetyl-CoA-carboxylase] ligase
MHPTHPLIGNHRIVLDTVDSTNTYAAMLLSREHPPEGTLITARNQLHGKGQDTNTWESEPGRNLTFTVILYPGFLPVARQFQLNKSIALALYDFTRRHLTSSVSIKWPNDIYIDDRKAAGILINHAILADKFLHSFVGIGININQVKFISDAPNPVSLKMVTGKDFDLERCLDDLCLDLDRRYGQLRKLEYEHIDTDYQNKLYRRGVLSPFRHENRIIHARITGVDEWGKIMLVTREGKKLTCQQKEIEYL